jgi:hypothetical protein
MTLYLTLYLATLVVHVALVSYVLVGAGWLAVVRDGAIRDTFKDWLPFAIGAAITAGVAPLLFVQILYQERFYTANLLLAHRWLAVVPALIIGFYAAYLTKARGGRVFPMIALVCFVFVAWSWTENHLLSLRDAEWAPMYGAGRMHYFEPALVPRLVLWLGLAAPTAATMIAWQVPASAHGALRMLAFAGLAVAGAAAAWLYASLDLPARDALLGGPGGALAGALVASLAIAVVAWWRRSRTLASIGMLAAIVVGAILRVRLRLPLLGDLRPRVEAAGGMLVFFFFFALNTALIVWCVRSARRHAR